MSYDFSITIDTGGPSLHHIEWTSSEELPQLRPSGQPGSRIGNYTSNVTPIWSRCLTAVVTHEAVPVEAREWFGAGGDDGTLSREASRLYLRDLNDRPCEELIELLRAAVAWGIEHIEELRELEPDNGWGDAEGAITYLWDIQRACEAHPKGKLCLGY